MQVGIIGLGIIGAGVARCLGNHGHTLSVFDIRPEPIAELAEIAGAAATPAAAADGAGVVVVSVLNDEQVRTVLSGPDGVLAAATPPRVLVLVSTVPIETIQWAAAEAARVSVSVVDCGVSGGPHSLAAGSIVAMVGGEQEAVEFARPVLEGFASPVIHMGAVGTGMAAKLGRNLMTFAGRVVAWEAMRVATSAGIAPAAFLEMTKASEKWSTSTDWLDRGLGVAGTELDEVGAGRSSVYAHKDLGAALELGRELGLDLPMAEKALELVDESLGLRQPEIDRGGVL
jgi:3-hydroxyisobutyrate dehydrogenase-like beta-hydroxyacid dehydrogenase